MDDQTKQNIIHDEEDIFKDAVVIDLQKAISAPIPLHNRQVQPDIVPIVDKAIDYAMLLWKKEDPESGIDSVKVALAAGELKETMRAVLSANKGDVRLNAADVNTAMRIIGNRINGTISDVRKDFLGDGIVS